MTHSEELTTLLDRFDTDREQGLSSAEGEARLKQKGENVLREGRKRTLPERLIAQFKDVMIRILIVAAAISFGVSWYEGTGFYEPVLILLIVFLNAIMGIAQESKAERALEALKDISAPEARVIRSGKEIKIPAAHLVPGDLILLEAGDYVPADGRIVESFSLRVEEAALTGESVPSEKDGKAVVAERAPLGDRMNMVYAGCGVVYGRAKALVVATGMDTEMGKIAGLLSEESEPETPLQKRLAVLGKYLGFVALAACVVIFIIGFVDGIPVMEIFMISVSLAVSAIPEGLPAIVTIILAIGVQRMVKQRAIIRRLPAVETLGSASVICSDKTGTLTQNRMTLLKAFDGENGEKEELGTDNGPGVRKLLLYGTLCSDGNVFIKDGEEQHQGDPTETAIVASAYHNGIIKEEVDQKYPRLGEIPFDSERKLMTTIHQMEGKIIVIVKGAFDVLVEKCVEGKIQEAKEEADQMAQSALRVLAVAWKEIPEAPEEDLTSEKLEKNLIFMGLVGMIDPPREEAKDAVALCIKAGIKPVMITGDHIATAAAIATQLGILQEGDQTVSGDDLGHMSDEDLEKKVRGISVYARVSPSDKIRIVRAWQSQGEVVAMTGDGVNDAPALKAADIGCAMGITGTDVAKGAADMTLTDDNFATIVEAVREGRGIYDNIRKVVGFLLGTNIGEILSVFFAILIWRQTPLLAMQLLWINLVTDSLPAIALGMEAVEDDIMLRKPRPRSEGIFAGGLGLQVLLQGVMFASLTLVGFFVAWNATGDLSAGRTAAFLILALSQVFHSFNMRSVQSLFHTGFFTNRYLNGAALISVVLVLFIVLIPPVAFAFGMTGLSGNLYLVALGLALVPIPVLELVKKAGFVQ